MTADDEFYRDLRYCLSCSGYVRYMRSWEKSYCVQCGNVVQIFSEEDIAWLRRDTSVRDPLTILSRSPRYDEAS